MPILQTRIAEDFDDGHLLNQKFLYIILKVINNLKSCEVFKLCYQPSDPIIDIEDFYLAILNVKMTQLDILPLLDAGIVLGN